MLTFSNLKNINIFKLKCVDTNKIKKYIIMYYICYYYNFS